MVFINDLPNEVLEFIFSHLPPYKDLEECSLVCKRWNRLIIDLIRHNRMNLDKALTEFKLCWKCEVPQNIGPLIGGRFSHAAAIHKNSMYIFGGGSPNSTTYNDLWRFDLSKRQWIRPLSMGTYPSPKACASMVCYKDLLILFGGWRYPSAYPPHQPWRLFDELHVYNIKDNRWSMHMPVDGPPPITGHSATIHHDKMIIFGGYQRTDFVLANSNCVWCLDLATFTWSKPNLSKTKPPPRYGHIQIHINDDNLLILGGCGGPNNIFNDAWILNMASSVWTWKSVTILNKQWTANQMWCNPACRVGSKLVILGPPSTMPSDFEFNHQLPFFNRPIRPDDINLMQVPPQRPYLQYVANPPPPFRPEQQQQQQQQRIVWPNPIIEDANRRLHEVPNRPTNRENINLNNHDNNNPDINPPNPNQPINVNDEAIRLRQNLQRRQRPQDDYNLPRRFNQDQEQERLPMAAFNNEIQNPLTSQEKRLGLLRRYEEKYSRASVRIPAPLLVAAPSSNPPPNVAVNGNAANDDEDSSNHGNNSNNRGANSSSNVGPAVKVQRLKIACRRTETAPSPKRVKRNSIALFVCDLNNVLDDDEPTLNWIKPQDYGIVDGAPERLIHSSFVTGNGELIMFGGLRKETISKNLIANNTSSMQVSNAVNFLTFRRDVF